MESLKKLKKIIARFVAFIDRHPTLIFARELAGRYFKHDVDRAGAALAYYFIFSFFPFLIFLSMLLGFLQLPLVGSASQLYRLVPQEVINIINIFLEHVTQLRSSTALFWGLFFAIFFPMRAVDSLMVSVRRAYAVPEHRSAVAQQIFVFFFTLFLILAIIASLVLITLGKGALNFLALVLPISDHEILLWNTLRFIILAVLLFMVITLLYGLALGRRLSLRQVWPGVVLSLAGWLVFSAAFSFYVENLGRYSLLYGSIGAVIILLLWLYLSAVLLIMGAEFNAALAQSIKKKRLQ